MTPTNPEAAAVILVTGNGTGRADQTLQHKLITTYFKLLEDSNTTPPPSAFTPRASNW